jgi:hypothetical protein
VAACLVGAARAGAATTFGSTLAGTPNIGALSNSVSTGITSNGISAAAPSDGVITAIRVRHGTSTASPGMYAYRILSGQASPFTARPATPSGANDVFLSWRPTVAATEVYFPTDTDGQRIGIPISAGERLALWTEKIADGSAAPPFWSSTGGTSSAARHDGGDHTSGTANYSTFGGLDALIQGTLEPDADGDRFGDDSQDLCKSLAGSQRGCPPGTVLTTGQAGQTVQVVQVVQTTVSGLARFTSVTINKARSKLSVGVLCPGGRSEKCQGSTSASTADKIQLRAGAAKKGVLALGSAKFNIKSGASKTLTIKISKQNRQRIKALKKLRLKLTLNESSSSKKTL